MKPTKEILADILQEGQAAYRTRESGRLYSCAGKSSG